MANEEQINLKFVDTKPIFADEVAIMLKVKAIKSDKGVVEKEGVITLVFIDMAKQQVIGEFVISKTTAKALVKILPENIEKLEKQLADKSMPEKPKLDTTYDRRDIR
jgi:hypothetical protein